MRNLTALRKGTLRFGGTGSWEQPDFWTVPTDLLGGTVLPTNQERIESSFEGYIQGAYKANGVVFACILARISVFSEARFQFQRIRNGKPGDLFGTPALDLLEQPWPNGTTGELLARMEQDVSVAGNAYLTVVEDRHGRRIRRLRPDWVTVVTLSESGHPDALDARVGGYIYEPNGVGSGDPIVLTPDQVVHWSPLPDPEARWRGMSWITPVVREVKADTAASAHKLKFFEYGATPQFVVTYDKDLSADLVKRYMALWQENHGGVDKAYRSAHVGGGADVKAVGADLRQLDFKVVQGAGETRIAAASGIHPTIVGLSEGLQGSSLNEGNFSAARRLTADKFYRPHWRSVSAALARIVDVPADARLWVDTADIAFLQEAGKDAAERQSMEADTIHNLVAGGFLPETVVAAVAAGDWSLLKHSGLYSVQLQPANTRPEGGSDDDA